VVGSLFHGRLNSRSRKCIGVVEHLCLALQIDFGIDVSGIDGDVSEPSTDGVDVYTARSRCVAVVCRMTWD